MFALLWLSAVAFAATEGRLEGTISDTSGAVLHAVTLTVVNEATPLPQTLQTGPDEKYAFPVLPVGSCSLEAVYSGFRPSKRTGIVTDANGALVIDVSLQPGDQTQTVSVSDSRVHVETLSTQVGEVISGFAVTAVLLNGRSFTELLSAEYGEFSGGQINVITKSGTDGFQSNLFEFLRNTDLDARNFFSPYARKIPAEPV